MGQPPTGDPEINDDPYPTENKDPKRRRIVFAGGEVAHPRVSRDVFLNPTPSRRARKTPRMKIVEMSGYGRMKLHW